MRADPVGRKKNLKAIKRDAAFAGAKAASYTFLCCLAVDARHVRHNGWNSEFAGVYAAVYLATEGPNELFCCPQAYFGISEQSNDDSIHQL